MVKFSPKDNRRYFDAESAENDPSEEPLPFPSTKLDHVIDFFAIGSWLLLLVVVIVAITWWVLNPR